MRRLGGHPWAVGSRQEHLLSLLAGLDVPSEGRVWFKGQSIGELSRTAERPSSVGVGFVFQTFQLLPGLSAVENVMLPLSWPVEWKESRQRAQVAWSSGPGERLTHRPRMLSGRTAALRGRTCFCDRALSPLCRRAHRQSDRKTGNAICDLLFELNASTGAHWSW